MHMHLLTPFRYIVPFIAFFGGYWACSLIIYKRQAQVPELVGKPVEQALAVAREQLLSVHLTGVTVRADLPAGIVLDQLPRAGSTVNIPQSIGVTISQAEQLPRTPDLVGKKEATLKQWSQEHTYQLDEIMVKSRYPAGHCCAQYPAPGSQMEGNHLQAFCTQPMTSHFIIPDFKGKTVQSVRALCAEQGIMLSLYHNDPSLVGEHQCTDCVILEQLPAAGTVVARSHLKTVHFQLG